MASDLYLLAHDEQSGRSKVAEPVAAVGLAAALIGELMLSGHLLLRRDSLYAVTADPPDDPFLRDVLHLLRDPRQDRDLDIWLRFLAADAVVDVRNRMITNGILAPVERRVIGLRQVRYLPANLNVSVWPSVRLARALSLWEPMPIADAVLVCLVRGIGLLGKVLWFPTDHAPGWEYADWIRQALPAELATLVAHTEVAVAEGVLTRRGL